MKMNRRTGITANNNGVVNYMQKEGEEVLVFGGVVEVKGEQCVGLRQWQAALQPVYATIFPMFHLFT